MNTINRSVPIRRQTVAPLWLIGSLGLILLLTGCTSAQVPAAPTAVPPTQMPTTATSASTFEGLSKGLDNAMQARIRATNAVPTDSTMDVYINSLPVINGGKPQQGLESAVFSGWVYVTPDTYTVTLVPHGKPIAQAWFTPVAVKAEAGHRYTVAAMGQEHAKNSTPLVIDETALAASQGAKPTDYVSILINNLTGIPGMDYLLASKTTPLPYGAATALAVVCPSGNTPAPEKYTVTGKPDAVIADGRLVCLPAASSATVWNGTYPDQVIGGNSSQFVSESTTMIDMLTAFNSHPVVTDEGYAITFNTLVAAIDKAGMRDQFAASDPYFFLAPTDGAFAALPKAKRETLLNDPQALTMLLKACFIDGYFPAGSLSGATYDVPDRAVTNRLGQKLTFLDETVNGQAVGPNYTVGNGNRMQVLYTLLPVK